MTNPPAPNKVPPTDSNQEAKIIQQTENQQPTISNVEAPTAVEEKIREIVREEIQGVGSRTDSEIKEIVQATLTELGFDRTGIREMILAEIGKELKETESLVNKTGEENDSSDNTSS